MKTIREDGAEDRSPSGPSRRELLLAAGAIGIGAGGNKPIGGGGTSPLNAAGPPASNLPPTPTLNLVKATPFVAYVEVTTTDTPTRDTSWKYERSVDGNTWVDTEGGPIYSVHNIINYMLGTAPFLRVTRISPQGLSSLPSPVLRPPIPRYDQVQVNSTGQLKSDRLLLQPNPARASVGGPAGSFLNTESAASGPILLATIINESQYKTGTLTFAINTGGLNNTSSGGWNGVTVSGNQLLLSTGMFDQRLTITGASKTNPVVLTVSGSTTFNVGDLVYVKGVAGMTQLNGNNYLVHAKTTTTLTLFDPGNKTVDATAFGTYTSGGTVSFSSIGLLHYLLVMFQNGTPVVWQLINLYSWLESATIVAPVFDNSTGKVSASAPPWYFLPPTITIPDNYPVGGLIRIFQLDYSPTGRVGNVSTSGFVGGSFGSALDRGGIDVFDSTGTATGMFTYVSIKEAMPQIALAKPLPTGSSTWTIKYWELFIQFADPDRGTWVPTPGNTTVKVLPHAGTITFQQNGPLHNGMPVGQLLGTISISGLGLNPNVTFMPDTNSSLSIARYSLSASSGTSVNLLLSHNWADTTQYCGGCITAGAEAIWIIADNGVNAAVARFDVVVGWAPLDVMFVGPTRPNNPTGNPVQFTTIEQCQAFLFPRFRVQTGTQLPPNAGAPPTAINGAKVFIDAYTGVNPNLEGASAYWVNTAITSAAGTWACPVVISGPGGPICTTPAEIQKPSWIPPPGCIMGYVFDIHVIGGLAFNHFDVTGQQSHMFLPGGDTSAVNGGNGGTLWMNNCSGTNCAAALQQAGRDGCKTIWSNFHSESMGDPLFTYSWYFVEGATTCFSRVNSIRNGNDQLFKSRSFSTLLAETSLIAGQQSQSGQVIGQSAAGNYCIYNCVAQSGPNAQNTQFIYYGETLNRYADEGLAYINSTFVQDLPGGRTVIFTNWWGIRDMLPDLNILGCDWWGIASTNFFFDPKPFTSYWQNPPAPQPPMPPNYGSVTYDVTGGVQSTSNPRPSTAWPQVTTFVPPAWTPPVVTGTLNGAMVPWATQFNNAISRSAGAVGDNLTLLATATDGTRLCTVQMLPNPFVISTTASVPAGSASFSVGTANGSGVYKQAITWQVSGPVGAAYPNGIPAGATATITNNVLTFTGTTKTGVAMVAHSPIYLTMPSGIITYSLGTLVGGTGAWLTQNATTGDITVHNNGSTIKPPPPNVTGSFAINATTLGVVNGPITMVVTGVAQLS